MDRQRNTLSPHRAAVDGRYTLVSITNAQQQQQQKIQLPKPNPRQTKPTAKSKPSPSQTKVKLPTKVSGGDKSVKNQYVAPFLINRMQISTSMLVLVKLHVLLVLLVVLVLLVPTRPGSGCAPLVTLGGVPDLFFSPSHTVFFPTGGSY
jgi:hypothetical protein